MRQVFADTLYWIASITPGDPWYAPTWQAIAALKPVHLVTTEAVLCAMVWCAWQAVTDPPSNLPSLEKSLLENKAMWDWVKDPTAWAWLCIRLLLPPQEDILLRRCQVPVALWHSQKNCGTVAAIFLELLKDGQGSQQLAKNIGISRLN